jgi:hypothetical protein
MSGTSWELKYLLEQFYMQFEKSCCIQLDFHSRSIIVQTNIFGGGSHYITTSYISQFCFFSKAKAERAFSGRRWAWEQGALAQWLSYIWELCGKTIPFLTCAVGRGCAFFSIFFPQVV